VDLYIFSCQNRIPQQWRPPLAPDRINGHNVRLIQLPCSAKLSTVFMLRPFEKEIDGVLVMACAEDACRSLEGSRRAKARVREANAVLEEIGLGGGRVLIRQGGGNEPQAFIDALEELAARVRASGLDPAREMSAP
jgi:coenzyme F420-reducing hydrogenase delta subunit